MTKKTLKFGEAPVPAGFWFTKAHLYHTENYLFPDERGYGFAARRTNLMAVVFPKITIDSYCVDCHVTRYFAQLNVTAATGEMEIPK